MASFTDAPVVTPRPRATAAQLFKASVATDSPLHNHAVTRNFLKFCGSTPPSKRQAQKFFAKYTTLPELLLVE